MAGAADATARAKGQYEQNGLGFSTGNQQAAENNATVAATRAGETNAQAYLQNYQAERAAQQNAPAALAQAEGVPLNYLNQVAGAYNAPLAQQGQIVSSLAGGGGTATPSTAVWEKPGIGNQVAQAY